MISEKQVEGALRDLEAEGAVSIETVRVPGTSFEDPPLYRITLLNRKTALMPMRSAGPQRRRELIRLNVMEGYASITDAAAPTCSNISATKTQRVHATTATIARN